MAFYSDYLKFGSKAVAIDDKGEVLTYAELNEKAEQIKSCTNKRTVVLQFCTNTLGSLCGYLSFLHDGIVPLMIDSHTDEGLYTHLIEVYQPDYLYLPETMTALTEGKEVLFTYNGYVLVKSGYEGGHNLCEELGLLLTTSGSVGSPKLVRQSYTNIQSNAASIVEYLEINENERPVTTLPMNYTYGLSVIHSHVLVGATILLTEQSIISRYFWDFAKKEGATSIAGVPFTYEMLKKIRFFRMDLPQLKTMTQAGGKLSPELHKEFAEYAHANGKKFIVMYGQTEATARMAYLPHEKSVEKFGSMGIVIPGGKLSLIDVNGNEITESDVVGELVYEGANVTLGYAECKSDLEKGDERGGRLETGDMAKKDDDGYFYVVGRKKRFLKLYGNRVNLDEIDRLVKAEFEADCASVGTDKQLIVYVTNENILTDVEVFLANKTHLNANAFKAVYIEEIPKNESGKTLYSKLANE